MTDRFVVVFGWTGFLGRRVVQQLLDHGFAVRVATRHVPEHQPRPHLVRADIQDRYAIEAAIAGAYALLVNTVSLYVARGSQTFYSVHVEAAARVASCARQAGVERFVHLSGIGADPGSRSSYVRSFDREGSRGDGLAPTSSHARRRRTGGRLLSRTQKRHDFRRIAAPRAFLEENQSGPDDRSVRQRDSAMLRRRSPSESIYHLRSIVAAHRYPGCSMKRGHQCCLITAIPILPCRSAC
jgi:UDP-glucose 4-epimerase